MRRPLELIVPFLRGVAVVAKREAWSNTKSLRLVLVSAFMALAVLAAAFGLSGLSTSGLSVFEQNLVWAHAAHQGGNLSDRAIVGFVSDAFGAPRPGVVVYAGHIDPFTSNETVNATAATDAAGGVRFANLTETEYAAWIRLAGRAVGVSVFFPLLANLSVEYKQLDIARAGYAGDVLFHVTERGGDRAADVVVELNGTEVTRTDANGFASVRLAPGRHALALVKGADRVPFPFAVLPGTGEAPLLAGPNAVIAFLALVIMSLMAPIFAIAMSYDAIAKERFTGSIDLLLIRPVSRAGIAVGKFLGVWTAVAIPTVSVALAGVAAVSEITGEGADAGFVAAFLAGTLFLLATYILLMQIFSTLTKTPGTAILAGFLVWLTFNVLWNLVFFLVSAGVGLQPGTQEYFALQNVFFLSNPDGVYQEIVAHALPPDTTLLGQGLTFGLPPWAGGVAAAVWIGVLLPLATWVFVRKSAK